MEKGSLLTSQEIPRTMKAVILESPQKLVYKEIPTWSLLDYDDDDLVLVKVAACGLCGSDLRYYQGENPWTQHTLGRFVPNPPNIVLGHEFAGEVVAVRHQRNEKLLGRRVAPICSKVCGTCFYCKNGLANLCPNTVHTGHGQGWGERTYYPGAYAEYVPVWANGCYEISPSLSWMEAAMMDLIGVSTHVTRKGKIKKDMPALIIGAGPIGNGVIQVSKISGAGTVVVIDQAELPLDLAKKAGADLVFDNRSMSENDIKTATLNKTNQVLPMTVIDTVGSRESFGFGLDMLGKGGTFVNVAVHDLALSINALDIGSEKSITTSCNFDTWDYSDSLKWLEEGKIQVADWIHSVSLAEIPAMFDQLIHSQKKDIFKVCIDMKSFN
ncbi:MAG: alcohol dehydrogenase catalytic domain-containing protein [bacterium]